jgi:predicted metal-dependent HD superfamily phosphohydrolase
MKIVYPVVLKKIPEGYAAYCPDIVFDTFGADLSESIEQARDALGSIGIDMEDDGRAFPTPTAIELVPRDDGDIVTLIDADLALYRKANERRTVRRNVSLPSWLDHEAEAAGINVSAVLQKALKKELGVKA